MKSSSVVLTTFIALTSCVQEMGTSGHTKPLASPPKTLPAHTVTWEDEPSHKAPNLYRGRELYDGHCAACHGPSGYGDGMVVQHGFPAPISFHSEASRKRRDSDWYKIVADGRGAMAGYGRQIKLSEIPSVIAYIRVLQMSQHANAKSLPAFDRDQLAQLEAP